MTRRTPKKKNLPSKVELSPGVAEVFVGKGISRRSRVVVEPTKMNAEDQRKYFGPTGDRILFNGFEERITAMEQGAIKILEAAGLPADPLAVVRYTRDGIEWQGNTLSAVEDEERLTLKWYAAKFLNDLRIARGAIKRGDAGLAADMGLTLGELATEVRIGFGYFVQTGEEGGGQKKHLPPVAALVRSLIRKNRKAFATELWEMVPTDSVVGIKINGYKFYRNGGRLLAIRKVDGCKDWRPAGKSLKYSAFRNRVTAARKTITR